MSRIRRLSEDHLTAILALHRAAAATMPPGLMADDGEAFFADHIHRLGRTYGMFEEGRLVAYGVLGLPLADSPNFGVDHALNGETLSLVAHIDGCVVADSARGRGLQRALIRYRMAEAERQGRSIFLSTAAPGNRASLANLLACGLTIRGLADKFGGVRFLLRRDVDVPLNIRPGVEEWLGMEDLAAHRAVLDRGLIGWRLNGDGTALGYAPVSGTEAEPVTDDPEPTDPSHGHDVEARLRRAEGMAIIERHVGLAGVGGLVPLAALDMAAVMTANLSMVRALAALHGRKANLSEARTVILAVVAGLVPSGVGALTVAALARAVPGALLFGMATGSVSAMAVTRLIGAVYQEHFETGAPLTLPRFRKARSATARTGATGETAGLA